MRAREVVAKRIEELEKEVQRLNKTTLTGSTRLSAPL